MSPRYESPGMPVDASHHPRQEEESTFACNYSASSLHTDGGVARDPKRGHHCLIGAEARAASYVEYGPGDYRVIIPPA